MYACMSRCSCESVCTLVGVEVCTCVYMCESAHACVSMGASTKCVSKCEHTWGMCAPVSMCGCVYTCVFPCTGAGRLLMPPLGRHQTFSLASFMRTEGPREVVSLCFTGCMILLSGLGDHAEDLLAVYIKMFIRRLSGLALPPSCRAVCMYLLPLKPFSPPLGSAGFDPGGTGSLSPPRVPDCPPRGACGKVAVIGPSICSSCPVHAACAFHRRGSQVVEMGCLVQGHTGTLQLMLS